MGDFRKILVALSLEKYSKGIFDYAARLAQSLNAHLIVANIINSRDVQAVAKITSWGYEVDSEHYIKGITEERGKILNQIIKESSFPTEKIKTVFKVGNPVDELLKMTLEEEVDMIVMGVKGRTDLQHAFVGSVADKIFRRSPVTVISYRDEKHADHLKKHIHLK
ncbi:MAG: universal stress protein [Gammaproteobacteria bacterium]|nr:universal stress protein [Gammaproteobacteria bacterium]